MLWQGSSKKNPFEHEVSCPNCLKYFEINVLPKTVKSTGNPTEISVSDKMAQNVTTSHGHPNSIHAIWNPNVATNWCLIFSPAFSSYLHALNWRTLGEPEREKSAKGWFYFSIGMLAVYVFMGLSSEEASKAANGLAFLYLLVWYFSVGRPQAKYVKEKLGNNYPRRPWSKPLLIGAMASIGYFIIAFIIGGIVGIAKT